MKTDELREAFLDFFVAKGCVRRPSDVLVPNDPTVLFTPAGMNQFKKEFMGLGDPSFKRAATCQKCLRTGDIENVGRTSFHETFFEMLGNFSFGDYFKREAIHWAWEFLTRSLKIPADQLTITVYLDDDEAYNIWHDEIKIPANRISRLGEDDNFWPAGAPTHGPNGVCGPCSEIFYHGAGPKEVEIWNLVFTQFNRIGPGQLEPLPKKNIDTGMGLERAAACLQGVGSVFETDIFKPIVAAVADSLGLAYDRDHADGVRIRRMADHIRALTFCIHENVRPGPEKQGYVIRRLLRRAVLDAYQIGRREPFLHQLVPVVADVMKQALSRAHRERQPGPDHHQARGGTVPPQPRKRPQALERHLPEDEGRRLRHDLRQGRLHAARDLRHPGRSGGKPGDRPQPAHRQVAASRSSAAGTRTSRAGRPRPPTCSPSARSIRSSGNIITAPSSSAIRKPRTSARVIGILEQNRLADKAEANGGRSLVLVLDRTPFYGESGGQVGDTGRDPRRPVSVPGGRHQEGKRLHPARRPCGRVAKSRQRDGERRGRLRPPRARSGEPTRPRISCTTPSGRSWASTLSRRGARSSPIDCGSTSPIPRRSAATGSARSKRPSTCASSRPPR